MTTLRLLFAAAALSSTMPAAAQPAASPPPPPPATQSDQRLKAIYDAFAAWQAKEYGYFEDAEGENQRADYLPKIDPASQQRRADHFKSVLAQVKAIPSARLSPQERDNAAVLTTILEARIADARFREWEMPVNSDSNFWTYLDARNPLDDAAAYRRYIGRMRDVPRYFGEHIANMRAGLKRGFTPPALTLQGRESSIEAFLKAGEDNAFYAAFKTMPTPPMISPKPPRRCASRCAPVAWRSARLPVATACRRCAGR